MRLIFRRECGEELEISVSVAGVIAVRAAIAPVWRLPWRWVRGGRLSLEVVLDSMGPLLRLYNDINCPKPYRVRPIYDEINCPNPYRVRPIRAGGGNTITCQQLNE